MAVITPGVDFLARHLVHLLALLISFAAIRTIIAKYINYEIQSSVLLAAILLSLPFAATLRTLSVKWTVRRQATSVGARVVPEVRGARIGNLDILFDLLSKFKTGYPG